MAAKLVSVDRHLPLYLQCDVYIGPKLSGTPIDQHSIWWASYLSLDQSLYFPAPVNLMKSRYMDDIRCLKLPKLSRLLNKRMGCVCRDIRFCHGHWLIKMMRVLLRERRYLGVIDFDIGYLIHKSSSPLSFAHLHSLKFGLDAPSSSSHLFFSAEHAYTWARAEYMGEKHIAKRVLSYCDNPADLNTFVKALDHSSATFTSKDAILLLYHITCAKWEQYPEFRELCRRYVGKSLLQGDAHKFWGCGLDFRQLQSYPPDHMKRNDFWGQNVRGWVVQIVAQMKDDECAKYPIDRNHLSFALQSGLDLCKKTLADAKLLSANVYDNLESWQKVEGKSRGEDRRSGKTHQRIPTTASLC